MFKSIHRRRFGRFGVAALALAATACGSIGAAETETLSEDDLAGLSGDPVVLRVETFHPPGPDEFENPRIEIRASGEATVWTNEHADHVVVGLAMSEVADILAATDAAGNGLAATYDDADLTDCSTVEVTWLAHDLSSRQVAWTCTIPDEVRALGTEIGELREQLIEMAGPPIPDFRHPDYVWTRSTDEVDLYARLFIEAAHDTGADEGQKTAEVVVDNQNGRRPVELSELTVAGPWSHEGDVEIFPLVTSFAPSGDRLAVAPGAVGVVRFVGSWPDGERIVDVSVESLDGSTMTLSVRPTERVDVPKPDTTIVEASDVVDAERLSAYVAVADERYLAGADLETRLRQLLANCADLERLSVIAGNISSRPVAVPDFLAQHAFVCPSLVTALELSFDRPFEEDLSGLEAIARATKPRMVDSDRYPRFVNRVQENCRTPEQIDRLLTKASEPVAWIVGWHAFVCPEVVTAHAGRR